MNFVSIGGETRTCFGSSIGELQQEAKSRGVTEISDLNSKRALCDILEDKKLVQKSQFLVVCGRSGFEIIDTLAKSPLGTEDQLESTALDYPKGAEFFIRVCSSSVSPSLVSSHTGKGKRLDEGGVILQMKRTNSYFFAWVTAEYDEFQLRCEEIVLPEWVEGFQGVKHPPPDLVLGLEGEFLVVCEGRIIRTPRLYLSHLHTLPEVHQFLPGETEVSEKLRKLGDKEVLELLKKIARGRIRIMKTGPGIINVLSRLSQEKVAAGYNNGRIVVWEYPGMATLSMFSPKEEITHIVSGRNLVAVTSSKEIWTIRPLAQFPIPTNDKRILGVGILSDSRIVTLNDTGTLKVYRPQSSEDTGVGILFVNQITLPTHWDHTISGLVVLHCDTVVIMADYEVIFVDITRERIRTVQDSPSSGYAFYLYEKTEKEIEEFLLGLLESNIPKAVGEIISRFI